MCASPPRTSSSAGSDFSRPHFSCSHCPSSGFDKDSSQGKRLGVLSSAPTRVGRRARRDPGWRSGSQNRTVDGLISPLSASPPSARPDRLPQLDAGIDTSPGGDNPRGSPRMAVTVPHAVRTRGATCVGNPTWVVPEESYRRVFRRYAVASPLPSALWKLPGVLAAGVVGSSLELEGYAGWAALSAVAEPCHGRIGPGVRVGEEIWDTSGTSRQRRLSPSRASSLVASRECQQCPASTVVSLAGKPAAGAAGSVPPTPFKMPHREFSRSRRGVSPQATPLRGGLTNLRPAAGPIGTGAPHPPNSTKARPATSTLRRNHPRRGRPIKPLADPRPEALGASVQVASRSGRQPSARSALFGYAVLRANFNHNAPSYLDNFTGFVLDILAQRQPEALDEDTVARAVRDTFGLTIPDRVVGLLLKRAAKRGRARTDDGKYYTVDQSALTSVAGLQSTMSQFQTQQAELHAKFVEFVRTRHADRYSIIADDPDAHLHVFIEKYAVPLLRRAERGRDGAGLGWTDLAGGDYLVGAFIVHLVNHDARAFGYVVDAVKGAILTGVLELGGGELQKKLGDLALVLDTPVLLKALGYHGPVQQVAVQQTLQLARGLGLSTVCFEHTLREVDGVLESAVPLLQVRGRNTEHNRAIDTYFLDSGKSPADVALLQASLDEDLGRLGISPIHSPGGYYKYGLDEEAVDATLKEDLPTQRESTRRYDVQSLSAIHRLREGSSVSNFERCRYVLVTDNVGLCIASRHIEEEHRWPLAMLDNDLAALLWVRSPATADDLPREQLLATVHAGMQPSAHLWMRYVEEIERLEHSGIVDSDEAIVLRTQPEARRALMDVTLGQLEAVTPESVESVLQRVRTDLEVPLRDALTKAQEERDRAFRDAGDARATAEFVEAGSASNVKALAERLKSLELERSNQEDRILRRSVLRAGRYLRMSTILLALILATAAGINQILPANVDGVPLPVRAIAAIAGFALVAVAVLQGVFGGSVKEWAGPIRDRLAERLERSDRRRAGLPPRSS